MLELWDEPGDGFFLHHTPTQVATITRAIHGHDVHAGPLVALFEVSGEADATGATEVFLYARDRTNLFADSVAAIDAVNLRIAAARVATSASGMCFNSYIVLDDGLPVADAGRRDRLANRLTVAIAGGAAEIRPERRISRQLKQFVTPTEVTLVTKPGAPTSTLRVVASDRPGLLATLGGLFVELGINVRSAGITTLGERIEDVFEITNRARHPITHSGQTQAVVEAIRARLDAEVAQSAGTAA